MLPVSHWARLLASMRGKRLGYVRGEHGNTGDTLQERACFELFRLQGLNVVWLGPVAHGREPWDWEPGDGLWNGQLSASTPVDELLLFGGGNMGLPGGSARIRAAAARLGLPMTILPNSWRATENLSGQVRYCARERGSIERYCPKAELFPDMALSFDFPEDHGAARPRVPLGVFLRNDREAKFSGDAVPGNQGPPFGKVGKRDVAGYLVLAAAHGVIVTDALHFGIAGLAAGRKVYLVPGAYHKNRSMYDSWLRDLGCLWADSPAAVPELRP